MSYRELREKRVALISQFLSKVDRDAEWFRTVEASKLKEEILGIEEKMKEIDRSIGMYKTQAREHLFSVVRIIGWAFIIGGNSILIYVIWLILTGKFK